MRTLIYNSYLFSLSTNHFAIRNYLNLSFLKFNREIIIFLELALQSAAISITTLILCILYLIWDWRKNRTPKKHDAPPTTTKTVNALPPFAPKRKTDLHEKLDSIAKSIGALKQSLAQKEAWKPPKKKKSAIEKLIENLRTSKKDIHPKNAQLRELKYFFNEKEHHPKYTFAPPKKPAFTAKELDKKAEDIKKRLMQHDKRGK